VGGNGNKQIYIDEQDKICYLNCVSSAVSKYDVKWLCFAIMPNHCHLLLLTERKNITKVLFFSNYRYSTSFKKKYNYTREIFNVKPTVTQKQNNREVQYAARYIHKNINGDLGGNIFTSYPLYINSFLEDLPSEDAQFFRGLNGVNEYILNYQLDSIKYVIKTDELLKYFSSNRKTAIKQFLSFHNEQEDLKINFNDYDFKVNEIIKSEYLKDVRFKNRNFEDNKQKFLEYINTQKQFKNIRNKLILNIVEQTRLSNVKVGEIFDISHETVRKIKLQHL
jgi:hypothetical protein